MYEHGRNALYPPEHRIGIILAPTMYVARQQNGLVRSRNPRDDPDGEHPLTGRFRQARRAHLPGHPPQRHLHPPIFPPVHPPKLHRIPAQAAALLRINGLLRPTHELRPELPLNVKAGGLDPTRLRL